MVIELILLILEHFALIDFLQFFPKRKLKPRYIINQGDFMIYKAKQPSTYQNIF